MEELSALIPRYSLAASVRALAACNETTARFGLTLSSEQMTALAEGRLRALRDTGRVEFGEGILPRLVLAFCDSPYLDQADYAETLLTLQEVFLYKNAFCDQITDDSLLKRMRHTFDKRAHGAAEYLAGMTPAELLERREEPADDEL